jgi:hypothetical protein
MATIEQLAGNTGESRIPYNVAPPLMQSPVTPQERRYENIASDILSLMSQTGAAMEATAKLGDTATKRLAIDNLKSFEKARSEVVRKYTQGEPGKPKGPNEIDYEALKTEIAALEEQYGEKFDTQRQQDIYDGLYTNPASKIVLTTTDKINEMQWNKDIEKVNEELNNNAMSWAIISNPDALHEIFTQSYSLFGKKGVYATANNTIVTIANTLAADLDDPTRFKELNKQYHITDDATGQLNMNNLNKLIADKYAAGILAVDETTGNLVPVERFKDFMPNHSLNNLNVSLQQIGNTKSTNQIKVIETQQSNQATARENMQNGKFSVGSLVELKSLKDKVDGWDKYTKSNEFKNLSINEQNALKSEYNQNALVYKTTMSFVSNLVAGMDKGLPAYEIAKMFNRDILDGDVFFSKEKQKSLAMEIIDSRVEELDSRAKNIYSKPMQEKDMQNLELIARTRAKYASYAELTNAESTYVKTTRATLSRGTFGSAQEALYYAYQAQEMLMRNPDITNATDIYSQVNFATYMISGLKSALKSKASPNTEGAVQVVLADLVANYKGNIEPNTRANHNALVYYSEKHDKAHIGNIPGLAGWFARTGVKIPTVEKGLSDGQLTKVNVGSTATFGGKDNFIVSIPDGKGGTISGSDILTIIQKLRYAEKLPTVGAAAAKKQSTSDVRIETSFGTDGLASSLRLRVTTLSTGDTVMYSYKDIQEGYGELIKSGGIIQNIQNSVPANKNQTKWTPSIHNSDVNKKAGQPTTSIGIGRGNIKRQEPKNPYDHKAKVFNLNIGKNK